MELSFIWYLNFLKQFARNERASEVLVSVPQQIYVLSQSFQVRLIWTFVPQNCTTETEGIVTISFRPLTGKLEDWLFATEQQQLGEITL